MEVLIDEVMSHLKVEDRDYFGLYYAFKEQRVGARVGAGWWCCACEVVKCCRA